MIDEKTDGAMMAAMAPNRWAYLVLLVITIGLGAPIYEEVRRTSEPSMGYWAAFALGVLAASTIAFPVYFAANWIVDRERNGKRDDLAAMLYRPALFPLWIFMVAAIKNIRDFAEFLPWIYLGVVLVLVALTVGIQRRRGAAWSWGIAVSVGVLIGLVALPIAGLVTWIIAPDQVHPGV